MTRYAVEPDAAVAHSKTRGSHLRVHFKHCREIAHHINGMPVTKAMKFLEDVLAFNSLYFLIFSESGRLSNSAMALSFDFAHFFSEVISAFFFNFFG